MLNLKKLIDMLPYYYKEADTYKDKNNKGILEKYLEIFGKYFQDDIVGDIKSLPDINKLFAESTDISYINYLWEFLGEMPFGNFYQIDPDQLKAYPDDPILCLKFNYLPSGLEPSLYRLLIYSISLYKIRGTQKFFEVLFRLYGLTCTITNGSNIESWESESPNDYGGNDKDYGGKDDDYGGLVVDDYSQGYKSSLLDSEDSKLDSNYNLDRYISCNQCRNLNFHLSGFDKSILRDTESYNSLFRACSGIIDRFIPVNTSFTLYLGKQLQVYANVSIYIIQNGSKILLGDIILMRWQTMYVPSICMYDDAEKYLYLQDGLRRNIQLYVEITPVVKPDDYDVSNLDKYKEFKLVEVTSKGFIDNDYIHKSGDIINISKAGSYGIWVSNLSTNWRWNFEVVRKSSIKHYNIGYKATDGILKITPDHPTVTIKLTGNVTFNGTTYPVNIRRVDTGEIYKPDVEKGYILKLDQGGSYTFELVDYPIKKVNFTISKEDEILEVTVDPEKGYISNGSIASTLLNVTGNYHKDKIMAIQAKDYQGALISYYELETYRDDYFADLPNGAFKDNEVLSNGYARTSIPLWDITYANGKPHARVSQIRICCLANPIRKTTQYIRVRKYDYANKIYINDVIDISEKLTMHDGGYINSKGEIVENSLYKYSDWLDVTQYQKGTGYYGAISRLEAWLICSPLTCHEVGKEDILYNCGDTFTADLAGSFTFVGTGDTGNGTKATFNVLNSTPISVSYNLTISSQSLSYGKDSDSVSLLVTIGTSLSYEAGKKYDKSLNFAFDVWKYDPSNDKWNKLQTISTTDKYWVVATNVSKYTKRYSLVLNKTAGEIIHGTGTFQIRSLDNSFSFQSFTVSDYIDPTVSYLYLEPSNQFDQGWVKPNWSTASIGDSDNTPANATYDLLKGTPRFKIMVLNGDPDNLNSINIMRVINNTPTIIDTVNYNETISNLTQEGTYIFSIKNDTSVQTARLTIIKKVNFKITCNPTIAILRGSTVSTQVIASCDDPNISTSKLQVKLVGDNTWYNTPYTFVAHTTGIYNFTVRGNEEGDEPTATFQVISPSSMGVSPTELVWEDGDATEQEVKLTCDDSVNWEIEVEDVDS